MGSAPGTVLRGGHRGHRQVRDGRRAISFRVKALADYTVPMGAVAEAIMSPGQHSGIHSEDRELSALPSPPLAPVLWVMQGS